MLSQEDRNKIQTLLKYYKHGVIKKKEELHYDEYGNLKKKVEIKYHSNGELKKKAEFSYPNTIVLESQISAICINPSTNLLYVSTVDSIVVIDGNTNKTLDKIKIKNPSRMIINPKTNKMYVFSRLERKSHAVVVIDLSSNKVIDTIFGDFKDPNHMVINSSTNMLYVTDWYGSDSVSVIYCDTNSIIDRIQVENGEHAIAVDENRNLVYVTNAKNNKVSIIDGFTNKIIGEIDVKEPVDVFINPDANILYIKSVKWWGCEGACGVETYLQMFDSNTYDLLKGRTLGFASPVCVTSSFDCVYLTCEYTFQKLDPLTNEIESVIWGTILGDQMVVNHITNKIYIANRFLEKIHMVNG
ncbi:MAG: YncE family protein [Thaumarchaeota archaeon]|nr:YncE family protein [Nitrososphaerota archaeon]